jgi:hypothetical protein
MLHVFIHTLSTLMSSFASFYGVQLPSLEHPHGMQGRALLTLTLVELYLTKSVLQIHLTKKMAVLSVSAVPCSYTLTVPNSYMFPTLTSQETWWVQGCHVIALVVIYALSAVFCLLPTACCLLPAAYLLLRDVYCHTVSLLSLM